MKFQEEFLHFIWQYRLYVPQISTVDGEVIRVISPGMLNSNAGPDFTNAKLIIGEMLWVGNVEIHVLASDWLLHNHLQDQSYENVILHVVYEDDATIFRKDGSKFPVFVIRDCFDKELLHRYEGLISAQTEFPCERQLASVDPFIVRHFLSRILIERLLDKTKEIERQLSLCANNWEVVFYWSLAKHFGFKVNAVPMEMLAQSIPYSLFAKHKDKPFQIEALIFGQAGFLSQNFTAAYPIKLKQEYQFLRKKYRLKPIPVSLWKFLRMRPQNFPTLRLAQFAALMCSSTHLLAKLLTTTEISEMEALFQNLPINPFWKEHYHFHKAAKTVNVQLGKQTISNLLVNTVGIFLFAHGQQMGQYDLVERALKLLEDLPPEKNSIIEQYQNAGVIVDSAFVSQALLQLKKKYCNEKKCLDCTIGIKILK